MTQKALDRTMKTVTELAQQIADKELEACCKWLCEDSLHHTSNRLRAARRPSPKPPETIEVDGFAYRLVK